MHWLMAKSGRYSRYLMLCVLLGERLSLSMSCSKLRKQLREQVVVRSVRE